MPQLGVVRSRLLFVQASWSWDYQWPQSPAGPDPDSAFAHVPRSRAATSHVYDSARQRLITSECFHA